MNKLTKIGASALCGSLAVISSANAGELSVAGGATMTYSSLEGTVNGNPLGMSTGMTFSGSGELDNGTTFALTMTQTDKSAWSGGSIVMTTPNMGAINFNHGAAGIGVDRYDDAMPTAWEETTGTALGTGLDYVSGVTGSNALEWTLPGSFTPEGMAVHVTYNPRADGSTASDKAVGGGGTEGQGTGMGLTMSHTGLLDGLTAFAGVSEIERDTDGAEVTGDKSEYVLGATYAIGGVTLGYQISHENTNLSTGTQFYDNSAYGISFAVNDDLSVSFGEHKSERGNAGAAIDNVEVKAKSAQIAYSMGGASIKIAQSSVDNQNYVTGSANDRDGTTVALSLAF
jgi:outer membrane protein OmpU